MIKNIIFDFGAVLIDWNPHYVFDPYFGDPGKADWFLSNICTSEWNGEMDKGKPIVQGVAELSARFPEWAAEIELYFRDWKKMVGGEIPGSLDMVKRFKAAGYGIYGLSNWSAETFCQVEDEYPVLDLMDGKVVSGYENLLKPEPEIYRLLLSRYGLKAPECAFVDDNPANVAGADAVGIRGILFKSPSQVLSEFGLL